MLIATYTEEVHRLTRYSTVNFALACIYLARMPDDVPGNFVPASSSEPLLCQWSGLTEINEEPGVFSYISIAGLNTA